MKRKAPGSNVDLVLAALRAAGHPVSAYDLLERLRPDGFASPATVYRALDRLVATGAVHKLETVSAFVVNGSAGAPEPTGFAICDCCGGVEPLVDPDLEARLAADAAARRFTPHRVTVEVHGLCGDCRDSEPETAA